MNSDKQTEVVAQFCGWRHKIYHQQLAWWDKNDKIIQAGSNDLNVDLNVMHEAEKCLEDDAQRRIYLIELTRACGNTEESTLGSNFWKCTIATAEQRRKAFVKTIGKWEE